MQRCAFAYLFSLVVMPAFPQEAPEFEKIDQLLFDSQFEQVITVAENTPTGAEQKIVLSNKKAEALIHLGRYNQALAELNNTLVQAGQVQNPKLYTAITETTLGFLYLNQGRTDVALNLLERAVAQLSQQSDALQQARSLSYLGQVYSSTGKYAQAEEQLQMALTIRQQILPDTHELIAASYNDLGMAWSQVDVDKALDYFDKAVDIYTKLHGTKHPKIAITTTNIGMAYRSMKLYGDALVSFEEALKIWETIYPSAHPSKAFVQINLGQTYASMGDLAAALSFYQKALATYQAAHGTKHPDIAYTFNLIGKVKLAQEKFDEALANYQQALIANVPDFENTDITSTPDGKNFYNGNQLLYSIMNKAQALEGRYFGKTLKQKDLNLALANLQECDALIDRLRQQITNESDKITLGAIANEVYADGARISSELGEVAFRGRKKYREQSFYFAEKSKSAVLLDAIADTNAKSFAGIPDDLLEQEKALKAALALVAQKLAQKPSEEEEKYLRETAFQLNQSYRDFVSNLEKQYPDYFNLKYNSASPAIAQLQQLVNNNTAIISYFIDDHNNRSRLYRYIITTKSFRVESRNIPPDYNRQLTGLRNSIYFLDQHAFIEIARRLALLLIPKLPGHINDLVILPSGRMSIIPFETLLTGKLKNPETKYANLPYLVNKFSIRYEFSAGLMVQKQRSATTSAIQSAMLCAPVRFPEAWRLADLPGTEHEVGTLKELLHQRNVKSEVLLNGHASETALKHSELKSYNLLHFATHGIVDENNPELSRIFLQTDSEAEDGNLFSGEIYNLQLNANLVTLSACQTGLGKISKGEGVIGLSRALVYAGAKNIIVSFWSVADESTANLMTDFYTRLLDDEQLNYSRSLQQAKLNLIQTKYSAPFYWAPFILIGF